MKNFNFYDTSSLLMLVDELFQNEDDERFGISSITLKELELIKVSDNKNSETKYAARKLIGILNENFNKFDIIVYKSKMIEPIKHLDLEITNDTKILASALEYQKIRTLSKVTFITNDFCLKGLAHLFFDEDHIKFLGHQENDNYAGYLDIILTEEEMSNFYQNLCINTFNANVNQYVIIRNMTGEIVDRLVWNGIEYRTLRYASFFSKWFGEVKPIKNDVYQAFAADSLINNQLTMLKGPAGSGKTYLSLGFLFSKLDKGSIDRIIIFCNTVATRNSARLGFYPGTRDEKLLDSQIGNLLISKIGSKIEVERLIDEGKLCLLPLSDIRGYETPDNSGVYISEAQNLDVDMMQLALTRIGENTICIIDGDDKTQVDLQAYAGEHNGMRKVSKIYRGFEKYGEVELKVIHRSKIAELAQKLKTNY